MCSSNFTAQWITLESILSLSDESKQEASSELSSLRDFHESLAITSNITNTIKQLLKAVQSLIIPFIKTADDDAATKHTGHGLAIPGGGPRTSLVEYHKPQKLVQLMNFDLPGSGKGKSGLLETVKRLLKYSVNTWDQGFLDKLYAGTNAVCLHSHSCKRF